MKQDDMREAMLALEKAKGRYRMYTIAAYVMCVFALVPAADFILTRSAFSMIAAFAAVALGFWIHGITSRAARGAMKQMNPGASSSPSRRKSMACRSVIWSTRLR